MLAKQLRALLMSSPRSSTFAGPGHALALHPHAKGRDTPVLPSAPHAPPTPGMGLLPTATTARNGKALPSAGAGRAAKPR